VVGQFGYVLARHRAVQPQLITLPFIRSHVAAGLGLVLRVRTRLTTLIGRQQMAHVVGAAAGIASINSRASRWESHGLRRATIVLEWSQHGIGLV